MAAERAQNSLRILFFFLSFKDADFRILLKLNFIEHQFREAKYTGELKTYLQQTACSQIEEKSSWFKQCNLERFHIQNEHVDVVILLNVSLSETGSGILGALRSHNVKSFTANRHLSVIFGNCVSAVDIAEEEMRGAPRHVVSNSEGHFEIQTRPQMFTVATPILGQSANLKNFASYKSPWEAMMFQELSDRLRDKVRDLTVTAEELLVFDTLSVVQASMTAMSLLPATSLDHNEYWNLPLKSVTDLIGNPGVCEANFKLPIYVDLAFTLGILAPAGYWSGSQTERPNFLCDAVHGILADVWLRAYFLIRETFVCSVLERYVSEQGRLQGILRIIMLRSTITDELQSHIPTDLALLGLFARLRPQMVYTTYIHGSRSTYDYIWDSDDSSHFVVIVQRYINRFGQFKKIERLLMSLPRDRNTLFRDFFCGQIRMKLSVSLEQLRCDWFQVYDIDYRAYGQILVRISMASEYWKPDQIWAIPTLIAEKLNAKPSVGKVYNVRWRRRNKY
ncbi:hypothetical protein CRM22_010064 [Opisthorchis felineus]|uniref:Uncharacterized protein n=1 Tax=Opisthorchis felineus TaxID=147828 RepID=A0A4S2L969_OPIFE|nr:hypothetical protein CRM22_010064 [Opisthorchis felineus]TGZ56918.1 hypothetical protein CRM22_010064 [Opisthorchis felineus]